MCMFLLCCFFHILLWFGPLWSKMKEIIIIINVSMFECTNETIIYEYKNAIRSSSGQKLSGKLKWSMSFFYCSSRHHIVLVKFWFICGKTGAGNMEKNIKQKRLKLSSTFRKCAAEQEGCEVVLSCYISLATKKTTHFRSCLFVQCWVNRQITGQINFYFKLVFDYNGHSEGERIVAPPCGQLSPVDGIAWHQSRRNKNQRNWLSCWPLAFPLSVFILHFHSFVGTTSFFSNGSEWQQALKWAKRSNQSALLIFLLIQTGCTNSKQSVSPVSYSTMTQKIFHLIRSPHLDPPVLWFVISVSLSCLSPYYRVFNGLFSERPRPSLRKGRADARWPSDLCRATDV